MVSLHEAEQHQQSQEETVNHPVSPAGINTKKKRKKKRRRRVARPIWSHRYLALNLIVSKDKAEHPLHVPNYFVHNLVLHRGLSDGPS